MKIRTLIILITLLLVISGCSNTRFLTKDEMLYTGCKKIKIINSHHVTKISAVKNMVKTVTSHEINNSLFGSRMLPPIGLWVYNYMEPKNSNKIRKWFYKKFSSIPVLISDVNPDIRVKKIENELFNLGYFNSKAWFVLDTNRSNPKKAGISYFVDLASPFQYAQITYDNPVDSIDTLINQTGLKEEIKSGDQFDLSKLNSLRLDFSRNVQENGYYFFNPDFIDNRADTTIGDNKMNLLIGKKKNLPVAVLSKYTINKITIKITKSTQDTIPICDTTHYNDITIISEGIILKPEVLSGSVFFKSGETYSYTAYQRTMNHLNNLGIFKFVRISIEHPETDSLLSRLDVHIDLVTLDKISIDFEANLVTKSSGFAGPALSVGISNGNTFKGAEKLHILLDGGFEYQWGSKSKSQLGAYSYEFGINTGLSFPKLIPLRLKNSSKLMMQHTNLNFGISILNRTAFYRMYSATANLKYQLSRSKEIQHSFYPLYLNSVKLLKTTTSFDSVVNNNIYIRKSFAEQFILGFKYEFSFNNSLNVKPNNFFIQAGFSSSGNIIDFFESKGKTESDRPYHFINNIYSQFIKLTTDFRYYRNGYNKSLVFRLFAGIGVPYGNSTALPYVEQFFSGGAYSIRGFTARYVGPGSFFENKKGYMDQSGDLKLESNLEYRFKMSKIMNGALFLETGNIWLINEDPLRAGAKFDMNTFYKQLAVGSGFGLRFDFTFFVLRTDLGFPVRTPYTTDNRNWMFGTGKIISGAIFYLAIGYPF